MKKLETAKEKPLKRRMNERKRQRRGTIRQTRVKCERDGTHEKFCLKLLCN